AEFVAPEADHLIDRSHRGENALGHFLQRSRAGEMAVEVVDHLQVVEIEKDDAEERSVAAGALDFLVEVALEEAAVERLRQIVAHRQIAAARKLIDVAKDRGDGAD